MSGPSKSSVPKFASFRPKPRAEDHTAVVKADDSRSDSHYNPQDDRNHTKRRNRGIDVGRKSQNREDNATSVRSERGRESAVKERYERSLSRVSTAADTLAKRPVADNYTFKIDLRGDVQNLQYGKSHRYDVPKYRRSGQGYIIGLDKSSRIELTNNEDLVIAKHVSVARDRPNYEDQRWRHAKNVRFIRSDQAETGLDSDDAFIPISRARKRIRLDAGIDEDTCKAPDYRGQADPSRRNEELEDSDLEYASDSSTERNNDISNELTRLKNVRLVRLTNSEPDNMQAWLDLIAHQREMVLMSTGESARSSSGLNKHALADIRSTIYERAIKSVKKGDDQIALILQHMDEVTELWESKRLADRWQDLLRSHNSSPKLWIHYLNFLQTNFTEFRFETCKVAYLDCLRVLSKLPAGHGQGSKKAEALASQMIYIFTRFTFMVREAGYSESAVALWQGALEYFALRPAALRDAPQGHCLGAFEQFWESEVARIGEEGALGWLNSTGTDILPNADTRALVSASSGNQYSAFVQTERTAESLMRNPGRTSDELGESDPYHIVLFSDIKPILSLLPTILSMSQLVQGYLSFAGLPNLVVDNDSLTEPLFQDPFLQHQFLQSTLENEGALRYKHCIQTTSTLFDGAFENAAFLDQAVRCQRTLELLVRALSELDYLAEYYLALSFHLRKTEQSQISPAKIAKSLLKARPNSLRLYNAYAITESRMGKSSFHVVFATSLSMNKSLPPHNQDDLTLLWRTWIWETLHGGNAHLARQILHAFGRTDLDMASISVMIPSSETTLRSSRAMVELRDHALSTNHKSKAVLAVECLALLHYLHEGGTLLLEAALNIYRKAEVLFEEREVVGSAAHESLHQARVELLVYHMNHSQGYKPAVVRDELQSSVRRFPGNTIVLAAFGAVEARFRIEDRVRAVFLATLSTAGSDKHETVAAHFFAIATEIHRMKRQVGTQHAVRAAFEQAVESQVGRHCPALWIAYLQFELDTETNEAKDVFFKGLTRLPWCKRLMMEAFDDALRKCMSGQELKRVYNVMEEKELRLYTELQES